MSVKIRLAVTGKTNQIAYRIVAIDTHTKRDGKFLEILGFYNPTSGAEQKLHIEKDKIASWVKKGAIITPAVALLIEKGTLERPKKPKVKPAEETQTAAPAQIPAPTEPQTESTDQNGSTEGADQSADETEQTTEKPAAEEVKAEKPAPAPEPGSADDTPAEPKTEENPKEEPQS